MSTQAPFGWTAIRHLNLDDGVWEARVYKRDCPADDEHFAGDLAYTTRPTRKEAVKLARTMRVSRVRVISNTPHPADSYADDHRI